MMIDKEPRIEIPRLLELARICPRPCMLNIPGQCRLPGRHSEGQCFACHGNSPEFNKGHRIKAHDFFSVWGCPWCHTWLDESYVATGEERDRAFKIGLFHQIHEWNEMLAQPTIRPKDAEPVLLALEHLAQRGYALRLSPGRQLGKRLIPTFNPIPPSDPLYARQ